MIVPGSSVDPLRRRGKREAAEVPEPRRPDKRIDKLLQVRKQRLERLERERTDAREAWRKSRGQLRRHKDSWRSAVKDAQDFWQGARADFFRMATTSGQFRGAKGRYERMKAAALQKYVECIELVYSCKRKGGAYFMARAAVLHAHRQQEKLGMLRDELQRLAMQEES